LFRGGGSPCLAATCQAGRYEMLVSDMDGAEAALSAGARPRRRRVLTGTLALFAICAAAGVGAMFAGAQPFGTVSDPRAAAVIPAKPPPPQSVWLRPIALVIKGGSRVQRQLRRAADNAARELAGSGDLSKVSWDETTGLWDRLVAPVGAPAGWQPPMWWQSALAMRSLVRFITRANDTQPAYQKVIANVYRLNISKPGTREPVNFQNAFMDDTAWWGLTWLAAYQYEHTVKHDQAAAGQYLALAESDAGYIASQPRPCHSQGIEFRPRYAPNTITNTEFVSLAAQLAQVRGASGQFHDSAKRQAWLTDARGVLTWLEGSGLVHMIAGTVAQTYTGQCRPSGKGQTYTAGEMADALTQMGKATHRRFYFNQAAVFINRTLAASSPMVAGSVLQEPCEGRAGSCVGYSYNITVFKGLFTDAVADLADATGSARYDPFLVSQAQAVLANSTGSSNSAGVCRTPASCQLSMYWARRVPAANAPIPPTPGSQASGLSALSDALRAPQSDRTGGQRPAARLHVLRRAKWPKTRRASKLAL
jgi:Glycosyl hydrolase family 76